MPAIEVKIQRGNDDPAWPDLLAQKDSLVSPVYDLWQVAGLAHGMESGAPSVMVRFQLPNQRTLVAENSLAAWIAATCVLRGAFPEAFIGTPLEA